MQLPTSSPSVPGPVGRIVITLQYLNNIKFVIVVSNVGLQVNKIKCIRIYHLDT